MTSTKIARVVRNTNFGEKGSIVVGLDAPKTGHILQNNTLVLAGWIITRKNVPKELILKDAHGEQRLALNTDRSDVVNNNQTYFEDGQGPMCGFRHTIKSNGPVQISIAVGDEVYPFLDVKSEDMKPLKAEDIIDRTVDFFVEMGGGEVPEILFRSREKSEVSMIVDIWSIAEICQEQRPGVKLSQALASFRNTYGVAINGQLKEALNQKILFARERELTHHGAMRTFRFWSEDEIDTHLEDVSTFLDRMSEIGLPSFIFFGTLLGVVRDNSLIQHDDDIDTVCILPATEGTTIAEYIERLSENLSKAGAKVTGNYPHHRHASLGRRAFDVFLGVDYGDTITIYSYKTISCARSDIFPMRSLSFRKNTYQVPKNSTHLIELYYGPAWRTPDKNFYDK